MKWVKDKDEPKSSCRVLYVGPQPTALAASPSLAALASTLQPPALLLHHALSSAMAPNISSAADGGGSDVVSRIYLIRHGDRFDYA